MVSTFSPNINLEEPGRGDDVGTWDTPVNGNMTLIDLTIGGITTIGVGVGSVVLSAPQYQCENITFNSTLLASINITFPTSFKKPYTIGNFCTGSSANIITLQTTAAGGQVIAVPPGVYCDVLNDGTNLKFKNLWGPIGSYFDYAGSSMPNWVSACTVPPLLNCDGSVILSSVYTLLPIILGSSLLPDMRGRTRFALDQGAGRISTAAFSSATVGGSGGSQATTLSSIHVPPVKITDPGHNHTALQPTQTRNDGTSVASLFAFATSQNTSTSTTGITAGSSSPASFNIVPPAVISGLTLIRAG